MAHLIDTNVLVRIIDRSDPRSRLALSAVKSLLGRGEEVYVFSQNLIEFWTVATRPRDQNGLDMTPERAAGYLSWFERLLAVAEEPHGVYAEWRRLILVYKVGGRSAHDARLAASMNLSEIDKVVTFDPSHFRRFSSIETLQPGQIA